jgi:hypothetical protein
VIANQSLSVPTDEVLKVVENQRNAAHTELAKAQVLIEHLAAENERLRGGTPDA